MIRSEHRRRYTPVEFGYLGRPYATENHALEALVADETGRDAAIVPGIDLAREAVGIAYDAMKLKLEYQQATSPPLPPTIRAATWLR